MKKLLTIAFLCIVASNASAVGYLKIQDIKGESTDKGAAATQPLRYASISVENGQLWLVGEDGKRTRVLKDGTYRSSDNKTYVLKNGMLQNAVPTLKAAPVAKPARATTK